MAEKKIVMADGVEVSSVPKITGVHPFGSKLLVEVLKPDEVLGTTLFVDEKTEIDGAPQAYIVEIGPQVSPDSGLKVGQRIYWTGKGTPVADPRSNNGRTRALLEISNVQAVIEE